MPVEINYVAILLATVINIALGFAWYGPLFGKQWMVLMGITKEQIEAKKAQGGMGKSYALMTIGSLVMAFVLWHALVFASYYTETIGISAGLMAGFWNWLGFVAPVTMSSVLWEGKSWKLWALNNGFYLVALLLMGGIMSFWL